MEGSPSMKAVIAPAASDPTKNAADPAVRNTFASDLRLLQVDFAVRDDRSPIGWIFGTFMYTGTKHESNVRNVLEVEAYILNGAQAWNRIIPVGIMWGNDPLMNQAAFNQGSKPAESWINPKAETLRVSLAGSRPSWGWNGRLNGPGASSSPCSPDSRIVLTIPTTADNFISSCASCHSVAQKTGESAMTQPEPRLENGKYIPVDDSKTMNW
ncbi:uncharacterized protein N7477_009876 [Penicillium maclennaniae]|uniref:uncharacterized protein n=1 Tax=Penicillium maclennaniae TaxID=1343394 RepID=UPI00253FF76C|nr:uncharacterized protein N7477_009876 [Penicillium maclennaniae]KAJ5662260.1 hypothetical protein N7477_009876 [Penicillium maclennaniae]